MSDLSAFSLPVQSVSLLKPAAGLGAVAASAKPDKMAEVASQFESSFVAAMLEPMFESLSTSPPFGGGDGEAAFKSFMVDAIAKQTAKAGGLHLSAAIHREMLKMQGAS
jgi:Rod binding domain-containing protein